MRRDNRRAQAIFPEPSIMPNVPTLLDCAAKGDVQMIERTLGGLFDVTPRKNTAFHIALRCGHKEFAKKLSDKLPGLLTVANERGETPLHFVARVGANDLAESFLMHIDAVPSMLQAQNENGDTPLHEAIRSGHAKVVCALVHAANKCQAENPENPHQPLNVLNKNHECPLYLAAGKLPAPVVETLMKHGALPVDGPNGQTVLHAAVRMRNTGVVEVLAKKYAELVRKQATNGRTALHYAAAMGSQNMVRYLLQSKSSAAYVVDRNGLSPMHLAARMGHIAIITLILKHCHDCADVVDKNGRSVLHAAVEAERYRAVKHMLKLCHFEELINQPDKKGYTPLHVAVAKRSLRIVRVLAVDSRVSKNAINSDGLTALDIANSDSNPWMVLRMVEITLLLKIAGFKRGEIREDNDPVLLQNPKEAENGKKPLASDFVNRYFSNAILVVILITTITFAAAFTMPGGWENNGLDEGQAVMGKRAAFKAFLISDTVAMCSSATVAFLFLRTVINDTDYKLHYYSIAELLMGISLLGTVVAFSTGVYVVVASKCLWLAVAVCVTGCSVPIFVVAGAVAPFLSVLGRIVMTWVSKTLDPSIGLGSIVRFFIDSVKQFQSIDLGWKPKTTYIQIE